MKPAVVLAWLAFLAGSLSVNAAEKKVPKYEGKPLDYWVKRLQKAENEKDREEAGKALQAFGPDAAPAIPAFLEMLEDHSRDFRQVVVRILWDIGPAGKAAVPALLQMLKNHTARDPSEVMSILGKIGPGADAAVPVLAEMLKDEKLRDDAAETLGKIGPGAALASPALLTAFQDSDNKYFRSYAIEALGKVGPPPDKVVPVMVKALEDEEIKKEVVRLLGQIGPAAKTAAPELRKALKDKDPYVLIEAANALWKIDRDSEAITVLAKRLEYMREEATQSVWWSHKYDVFPIVCKAAAVLGEIGPAAKEALPELKKKLADCNSDVRKAAAEAVRKIDPEEGRKIKIDGDGSVIVPPTSEAPSFSPVPKP